MKTTIDRAGRVVIPKPVRDAAGWKAGEELEVAYRDGRVEIDPVPSRVELVRKGSLLVASAPGAGKLTHKQVNETIQKLRERRG